MVVEVWSKEEHHRNLPKVRDGHIKAWVNIMYGCDKFCTLIVLFHLLEKERSRRQRTSLMRLEN